MGTLLLVARTVATKSGKDRATKHPPRSTFSHALRLLHAKSYRLLLSSPKEETEARRITDILVRLSVGIEDVTDLLDDVRQALERSVRVEGA